MLYQEVAELEPLGSGDDLHEAALDLVPRLLPGQPQPLRQPHHVGVDGDPLDDAVGVAEDDVRRLPGHPLEPGQLLHRPGDLAAVLLDDGPAGLLDEPGLLPVEPQRPDGLLQLLPRRTGVVLRRPIPLEEARGDLVHLGVGGLRRQDGRHEELQGRLPAEGGPPHLRVRLLKPPYDLLHPRPHPRHTRTAAGSSAAPLA